MDLGTIAATTFPVVTLVIGHALATRSDRAKDQRAIDRERAGRAEERRDRLLSRRAEFQRGILVELQDVAIDFARDTGALHHQDLKAHRSTGEPWGRQLLPDDLSERHAFLTRRMSILEARLGPGAVQAQAEKLRMLCTSSASASSEREAVGILSGLTGAMDDLNGEVGAALRRLDALENEAGG